MGEPIPELKLTSVEVSPPTSSVPSGTALQLVATGVFSDGARSTLTTGVVWSASGPQVSVSDTGMLAAASVGRVTVTATVGDVSGWAQVEVTPPLMSTIEVGPATPSVPRGIELQLTATGVFTDGTKMDLSDVVTWTSSDPAIVSVPRPGWVVGSAVGNARLTATLGDLSGFTTVTVTPAVLSLVQVSPAGATIANGTSQQLTATGLFSDGTRQDVSSQATWWSSDPAVISVAADGLAASHTTGVVTVRAELGGSSGMATITVTAATLAALQITPALPAVAVGSTLPLSATGVFTDSTTQDLSSMVTWDTTDTAIAEISQLGVVTGIAPGSATLSVTLDGVSAQTRVEVTPATLVTIELTPAQPSIAAGTTQLLTATGVYSDGTTQDLSGQVAWASADPSVATVANAAATAGLVTGVSVGAALITAALGSVTTATVVTVTSAVLTSIDVLPVDPVAPRGTTLQFEVVGTFSDGTTQDLTDQATWSSSDSTVVSISNAAGTVGLASALAAGTADVTATHAGFTDVSTVTVSAATLTAISVSPSAITLAHGFNWQFTANGTYSDGTTLDITSQVTWSSSNTAVATISNAAGTEGLATGVAPGTATLTATLNGTTSSATMTVTSAVLTGISVTPASPRVAVGFKLQLRAVGGFSDGSTLDLTTQVLWTSSNTSVVSVSNASGSRGWASSLLSGTATVSAVRNGFTGATLFTATNATLMSIAISPANATAASKVNVQLGAAGTFSDASVLDITTQVAWKSSPKRVVAVNRYGVARTNRHGTASITARRNGVTGSTSMTVQ